MVKKKDIYTPCGVRLYRRFARYGSAALASSGGAARFQSPSESGKPKSSISPQLGGHSSGFVGFCGTVRSSPVIATFIKTKIPRVKSCLELRVSGVNVARGADAFPAL